MCSWSPDRETNDIGISLEITEDGYAARYSFVIGVGQQGILQVKYESTEVPSSLRQSVICFETEDGKWVKTPTDYLNSSTYSLNMPVAVDALMLPRLSLVLGDLQTVLNDVTSTNFYAIFPNTLRLPQPHYMSEARLIEDGRNLATILRRIIRQKLFHADLVAALGYVVAGIRNIRVQEVGGYLVTELEHEMQNGQTAWFPLAQESDGTLRVLGLLAALYQDAPHSLIAIEEPELSIHPGALEMLSEVIEEAATRSQVLITTQSPDLISQFSADELRIVERISTETRIGPIDEGQRETINSQLFSAGDLLRIEGLHVSSQEEPVPSYA